MKKSELNEELFDAMAEGHIRIQDILEITSNILEEYKDFATDEDSLLNAQSHIRDAIKEIDTADKNEAEGV